MDNNREHLDQSAIESGRGMIQFASKITITPGMIVLDSRWDACSQIKSIGQVRETSTVLVFLREMDRSIDPRYGQNHDFSLRMTFLRDVLWLGTHTLVEPLPEDHSLCPLPGTMLFEFRRRRWQPKFKVHKTSWGSNGRGGGEIRIQLRYCSGRVVGSFTIEQYLMLITDHNLQSR